MREAVARSVRLTGDVEVVTSAGKTQLVRCPQHISLDWLRAAVRIAPVEAVISEVEGGRAFLWAIFPASAHAAVRAPFEVRGTQVKLEGSEGVQLICGSSAVSLNREGEVRIRGRDVLSRASQVNRIKGGRIKLN
jgi:hypothetical protein